MEKLISNWCMTVKSLPQEYVFPEETRPGDKIVPNFDNCHVIDLEKTDRNDIIQQVLQASRDCGLFQVINHGISEDLIKDAMEIVQEFFNMPNEDKASLYSTDPQKSCRLYTSSFDYVGETVHRWRDVLKHVCDPVDGWVDSWPQKPSKYRDVIGKYSLEVRKLSFRILEMIHEGLGLNPGNFGDELTGTQNLLLNHYPPCPDPGLALGISKHSDPNIITILYQEKVGGLQVMKDGQWVGVELIPNALVVMIGHLLKVISNGKLESAEHRAVTNAKESRYTIGSSINPLSKDVIIEPAKALLEKDNCPPLYRAFSYKDYHQVYKEKRGEGEPTLEMFKIKG